MCFSFFYALYALKAVMILLENEKSRVADNGSVEKKKRGITNADEGLKKVSSAAGNMSALVDDIVKKARKNFKETGKPDVDAKFLKESVGALKELYELLEEADGFSGGSDGVFIRFDNKTEEWGS